jgi:hypothetical protein
VILGAALLVLVALALFVGGIATGATALYYACIAVALVAVVLLVLSRWAGRAVAQEEPAAPDVRRIERTPPPPPPSAAAPPAERTAVPHDLVHQDDDGPGRAIGTHSGASSVTDGTAAPPPVGRTVEEDTADVDEPAVEEVEVTDLLLVMDLHDDVVVVDEHPRYHLASCAWLRGRTPIPLPIDEARTDGFTPCAVCSPDRHLAAVERERRAGRGAS